MKRFALPVVYVVYTRIVIPFLRSSDFIIYCDVDGINNEIPIQYYNRTLVNEYSQTIDQKRRVYFGRARVVHVV